MEQFWNERYQQPEYAYGTKPNSFLESRLPDIPGQRILFPADGEGRNGVFAARKGWQVSSFDYSQTGREKALALAKSHEVDLEYEVADVRNLSYPLSSFDAIVLIFAHFPRPLKHFCHIQWNQLLKPGGHIVLEAFSKDHLLYNQDGKAGGPRDEDMLYSVEEIIQDFPDYEKLVLEQTEVVLEEGLYHNGLSSVVRFVGKKPL